MERGTFDILNINKFLNIEDKIAIKPNKRIVGYNFVHFN